MQDRPTAVELLKAAQEFCEKDLGPQLTGRLRFHTRVLQNVLGILEREWESEEAAVRAEWERLKSLMGSDDQEPASFSDLRAKVREANMALASEIRSGSMDDSLDEAAGALYETVVQKLEISNTNHL